MPQLIIDKFSGIETNKVTPGDNTSYDAVNLTPDNIIEALTLREGYNLLY